jgi:hypothetical protein
MGNSAVVRGESKRTVEGGGSALSLLVSFVNPNKRSKEQIKADRLCKEKQTKSVEYVVSHLYYSMPVNIRALDGSTFERKLPYIEIDHQAAQEMIENEDRRDSNRGSVDVKESPLKALRKTYPESVTVKENGDIEIEHFEPDIDDTGDGGNMLTPLSPMRSRTIPFDALCNVEIVPGIMDPPRLTRALMNRIDIEWDEPAQDQLVERHEVQYRPAEGGSISSPSRWRALCTKNRMLGHQPRAFLGEQKPASKFVFRIRQGSPAGWSEWSNSSPVYSTKAGRPSQMDAPFASSVGTDLIMLHWVEPDGNGAPIMGYTLRGKMPGGEMKAVYVGPLDSCVVTSVDKEAVAPERIYSFDVCAYNEVGHSTWSEPATFKTIKDRGQTAENTALPENALRSRNIWIECWDASTEQVFYFNKFTGLRTHQRPAEFDIDSAADRHDGESSSRKVADFEDEEEKDPAVVFRMRRYRLLRKLYKVTGNATGAVQLGGIAGSPSRRSRHQSDGFRLTVNVRRETIYEDSFKQFRYLGPHDLVRKTKVHFENEEGIDSGGLTKDWYLSISKAIAASGMFKQVDGDSVDLEINPDWRGPSNGDASKNASKASNTLQRMNSSGIAISEEGLDHFRFVGKLIGKAIYDRHTMILPMNRVFYKILRNDPLGIEDLEQIDPALHKSLAWMLENSVEGILFETFSIMQTDDEGNTEHIDLCEKGRDRDVTDENKTEYVELLSQYRLQFGTLQQMEAIVDGISITVPLTMLQEFDVREIELLVNGREEIDVDEIRAYTIFQGKFNEQHRIVLWLWQILRAFEPKERSLFLQFVTGAPRLPLDGFDPPFNVTEGAEMDPLNALPTAHTCFNQLVLPRYGDIETFTKKLKYAIQNSAGFQMS